MADSTYLKNTIEPFIVDWVSKSIGVKLYPMRIAVGRRGDGTEVYFNFDGVSENGKVGLLVSSSQTVKSGANRKLYRDASILLRAPFKKRIMAFVNQDVARNFVNKCDGLLPLGDIEMLVCDCLPKHMTREIERFQSLARVEVGDKGIRKLTKRAF